MARTSNVFARVEPELKEQAEQVLSQLGIPMSNAVSMFLRQVVLQRGIPFEMKLPKEPPLVYGKLTKAQLDAALERAWRIFALGGRMTPRRSWTSCGGIMGYDDLEDTIH